MRPGEDCAMRAGGIYRAVVTHPSASPALILRSPREARASRRTRAAAMVPLVFLAHGSRRAACGRAPHHEGVAWGNRPRLWLSLAVALAFSFAAPLTAVRAAD